MAANFLMTKKFAWTNKAGVWEMRSITFDARDLLTWFDYQTGKYTAIRFRPPLDADFIRWPFIAQPFDEFDAEIKAVLNQEQPPEPVNPDGPPPLP